MGQAIINHDRHNNKVLRAVVESLGGEATRPEVRKRLFYSDEKLFDRAVKRATSISEGGKGLMVR